MKTAFTHEDINRIVEMAWEDRTPFEAIKAQFGLSEAEVIKLMKREMTGKSWLHWRKHVNGRKTKHAVLRSFEEGIHKSRMHRTITLNKISKRRHHPKKR